MVMVKNSHRWIKIQVPKKNCLDCIVRDLNSCLPFGKSLNLPTKEAKGIMHPCKECLKNTVVKKDY